MVRIDFENRKIGLGVAPDDPGRILFPSWTVTVTSSAFSTTWSSVTM
jgi:hypothetical protein